jgi:hypothetical protein
MFKAILALLSPDRLPPNAISLRDNQYEADEIAVRFVTGDLNAAISCLRKLSGGKPNAPSHNWELWGIQLPAMTLQERIAELRSRTTAGQFYLK